MKKYMTMQNGDYVNLSQSIFKMAYLIPKSQNSGDVDKKFLSEAIGIHPDKKIRLLASSYLGMGHFGVVIDDAKGNYHALMLGGSNGHDHLATSIAYMFYQFDKPNGKIEKLEDNMCIIFNNISLKDYVSKIYYRIIDSIIQETTEKKVDQNIIYQLVKKELINENQMCDLDNYCGDNTEEYIHLDDNESE